MQADFFQSFRSNAEPQRECRTGFGPFHVTSAVRGASVVQGASVVRALRFVWGASFGTGASVE